MIGAGLVVVATDPDAPEALALLEEGYADLLRRYPSGAISHASAADFRTPVGRFYVARLDGVAVGCCGFSDHVLGAEVKRLFVRPAARRRGVAWRLLEVVEAEARRLGYTRVILETGEAQPEAMQLYARCGYEVIARYAPYEDWDESRCFAKAL